MAKIIERKFDRVAPATFKERAELPLGWFVIRYSLVEDKGDRRKSHGRWYKIKSDRGTIYRTLRYSVKISGSNNKDDICDIVLDWAGWIDLQGRNADEMETLDLRISPLSLIAYPLIPIRHPDSGIRISGWLGLTSIGLGLLSVVLAICLT